MAPNLDLKTSLTLRVVAVAVFCFVIAAALALFGTYREVRQLNEHRNLARTGQVTKTEAAIALIRRAGYVVNLALLKT
jgi:hypothetical protein